MSLRVRLFVTIGLSVLLSVGITLGVGTYLISRELRQSALAALSRQADLVAARGVPLTPRQLRAVRAFLRQQGQGLMLVPSALSPALPLTTEQRTALQAGRPVDGEADFRRGRALFAARETGGEIVLLYRSAGLQSKDWRPFLGGLVVSGLVGTALAAGASYLLARSVARPVGRVAEASRRLAAGEAPEPVPVEGHDELAVLSSSFNDMAAQLASAREAEQAFLLSVSHELKTPLTAIRGYAEAIEEGAVAPGEAAEVIGREGERLERLVQDLLDLARLNRRAFAIRREPVDLGDVAREAVRRYEPRARGFGVRLEASGAPAEPVLGDPDRMLQVVSNLCENALRSTPAGGAVAVEVDGPSISVRDTGPGIAAEDLPRAFDRFFLSGRYRGERAVGSGLGLAVVRELTEAMGGSVSVSSAAGAGSVFTVRLPVAPARPDRDEAATRPSPEAEVTSAPGGDGRGR